MLAYRCSGSLLPKPGVVASIIGRRVRPRWPPDAWWGRVFWPPEGHYEEAILDWKRWPNNPESGKWGVAQFDYNSGLAALRREPGSSLRPTPTADRCDGKRSVGS